ncbi:hypothetical protein VFPPC_02895 [Pochonia chlamydosporia 170]|uniref:Uncharacterized protein n=1 Tax=Pochonia chlamydosporia 170 TaxID=1380566 RepID=A0A179FZM5_METCM|nr:hypothetical protein VFPPC_02895 [Pochonia chlamydosporia 170]OAQ70419.1 hypothetical protein VFPPC_02895 [Pochonia chlamydosporia 170]
MKDSEFAELPRVSSLSREEETRRAMKPVWMLTYWGWGLMFTAALFFIVASLFGPVPSLRAPVELIHAEYVVSKAAHQLAIRADCNETAALFESAADAITANALGLSGTISASRLVTEASQLSTAASAQSATEIAAESVPISTQTALSTIYSIKSTSEERTLTSTTTGTTTITVSPVQYTEASVTDDTCPAGVTETVVVTVYPAPDVTVTAGASTVTNVNTQVSYTSGLPDVTLSGNPSTYTAIQTDVSLTTGPPDATVSQDPATVTNVQTDITYTTGPPDATVSQDPSTVTDVQISWSWPLTSTYATPVTTLTISDLWGSPPPVSVSDQPSLSTFTTIISSQVTITITPSESVSSSLAGEVTSLSPSPTSTYTETVTETGGPPAVETTTVDVYPPAYTSYNTTSTSTSITTPIIISAGNKRPEPKGWGGSNGGSNVACTIMLIAVFMFML